jgi:integrase/recombinase XerD
VLSEWLHERQGDPNDPVFPTRQGRALSQDAITKLLAKHTAKAADRCRSLAGKRVTPHVLRHYVDGWVMWPPGVFRLLTGVLVLVAAT